MMSNGLRRIWQHEEIVELLRACLTHKTDYIDFRHRTNTLKFILSDLKCRGIFASDCTFESMRLKLKYLRKCWNNTKSGYQPIGSFSLYKDMCDELFGAECNWRRRELYHTPPSFRSLRSTSSTELRSEGKTLESKKPETDEELAKIVKKTQHNTEPRSKETETDEAKAKITKEATQRYFKSKMDEIIGILNERNDILQNYLKEKMKLKEKARLAKQRRESERAKVIQEILENKEKWGRLNLQDVELMLI